jgi:hypothetical protein
MQPVNFGLFRSSLDTGSSHRCRTTALVVFTGGNTVSCVREYWRTSAACPAEPVRGAHIQNALSEERVRATDIGAWIGERLEAGDRSNGVERRHGRAGRARAELCFRLDETRFDSRGEHDG